MANKKKPDIREEITEIANRNVTVRQDLHQNPQTGFEETYAHGKIISILDSLNIEYEVMAETGVVATIESKKNTSGKTIGIRVDIDALNIQEASGVSWTSQNPGKMHACGHDGHTTIGLTAAEYLAGNRDKFNGTVKIVFQPAEEGMGGAKRMIKEGLFEKHPMSAIYAIHNDPQMDLGEASVNKSAVCAGNSNFKITVNGVGAHGAKPEQGMNPVPIAARMTIGLEDLVEQFNKEYPREKLVLSVCSTNGGIDSAPNVIPDKALMTGTIRTHNNLLGEQVRVGVKELANKLMRKFSNDIHSARIDVEWTHATRPTKNTEANAEISLQVLKKVFGANRVAGDVEPSMGSEDFGEYEGKVLLDGTKVAASYVRLGQRDPENPEGPHGKGLHNPGYDFNDGLISPASEYMARIVEKELPIEP